MQPSTNANTQEEPIWSSITSMTSSLASNVLTNIQNIGSNLVKIVGGISNEPLSDEAIARQLQEEEKQEASRRRLEEEALSQQFIKQLLETGEISPSNPYQEEEERLSMEAISRLYRERNRYRHHTHDSDNPRSLTSRSRSVTNSNHVPIPDPIPSSGSSSPSSDPTSSPDSSHSPRSSRSSSSSGSSSSSPTRNTDTSNDQYPFMGSRLHRSSRGHNRDRTTSGVTTTTTTTTTTTASRRDNSSRTNSSGRNGRARLRFHLGQDGGDEMTTSVAGLLRLLDNYQGGSEENRRRIRELLIVFQQINDARRIGNGSYESLLSNLQDVKTPAKNKDDMPVYIWKEKENEKREGESNCSICLSEYETGNEIKILPCLHKFHKDCIDSWLDAHNTCPVCKYKID